MKKAHPIRAMLRVLITDDYRDGADTLGAVVRLHGHEPYVVYSGDDALKVAAQVHPHLAFLDIGMPILNGLQVGEMLRKEPWASQLFIVAVTGWGQEKDRRATSEAGFDLHLTKPIEIEQLAMAFAAATQRLQENQKE